MFWEVRKLLERMEVRLWSSCHETDSISEWESLEMLHSALATWKMILDSIEEAGGALEKMEQELENNREYKLSAVLRSVLLLSTGRIRSDQVCALWYMQQSIVYPTAFPPFYFADKYSEFVSGSNICCSGDELELFQVSHLYYIPQYQVKLQKDYVSQDCWMKCQGRLLRAYGRFFSSLIKEILRKNFYSSSTLHCFLLKVIVRDRAVTISLRPYSKYGGMDRWAYINFLTTLLSYQAMRILSISKFFVMGDN